MFNSPILDVTIGLVFVFLLYSLLVTSINEAIASSFALRARMLKNAIAERMLSNVSRVGRWQSIWQGFVSFWMEAAKVVLGSWVEKKKKTKLGDKFYDHPIIKNYSSSRVYATPSYIPKNNFSTVLIDILKDEFDNNRKDIVKYKFEHSSTNEAEVDIDRQLSFSPDIVKVKEIIEHYGRYFVKNKTPLSNPIIDKEAWEVIRMHMNNSGYDFEKFVLQLETWFDDTMDRVSGWYKRQTQFFLFWLGFLIAIMFNVDSIDLANKLSTNTDARKILVANAISFQERYDKKEPSTALSPTSGQPSADIALEGKAKSDSLALFQQRLDSLLKFKRNEIDTINSILALGWGDYGLNKELDERMAKYKEINTNITKEVLDKKSIEIRAELQKEHNWWFKVKFIFCSLCSGRKIIGLLMTAFALSLGAPFWFDMLNKVVRLRNSGVKEDRSSGDASTIVNTGKGTPIIINNQLTEEAQG